MVWLVPGANAWNRARSASTSDEATPYVVAFSYVVPSTTYRNAMQRILQPAALLSII